MSQPSVQSKFAHATELGMQPIMFESHIIRMSSEAGARVDFQKMVYSLVDELLGGARTVDDTSGDWGIDTFRGDFGTGSVDVWQAKYFRNGIGRTQQNQIRQSFNALLDASKRVGFSVGQWVLATSGTMSPESMVWWDRWAAKQQRNTGVELVLWDGPRLEELLANAPETSDRFFSNSKLKNEYSAALDLLTQRTQQNLEDAGLVGMLDTRLGGGSARLEAGLYVARELEARAMAGGSGTITALVGEAGNGKTSMLWSLARLLVDTGNTVWFLRAQQFLATDAAQAARVNELAESVAVASSCTADASKAFLVLDTVDVLLHENHHRDRLFELIRTAQNTGVRTLVACRPLEAAILPLDTIRLEVRGYSDQELISALKAHQLVFTGSATASASYDNLLEAVRWETPFLPVLKRPLTLRMLFEIYSPEDLPDEINAFELFREFWERRIATDERSGAPIAADDRDLSGEASSVALRLLASGLPTAQLSMLAGFSSRPHLTALRQRGVLAGDDRHAEFFHQAFFEHAAGRAVADHDTDGRLIRDLVARASERPDDAFLWPVVEQSMLHVVHEGRLVDWFRELFSEWICSTSPSQFAAALGIWAQATRPLNTLTEMLGELLNASSTPEIRKLEILQRLGALRATRLDEVFDLAGVAWDGPIEHKRAIVRLLPTLAFRAPARLMRFVEDNLLADCSKLTGLVDQIVSLAQALIVCGATDPLWAGGATVRISRALHGGADGNFRRHIFSLLADSPGTASGDQLIERWVDPLIADETELSSLDFTELLDRIAEQDSLSATQIVARAERSKPILSIGWLQVLGSSERLINDELGSRILDLPVETLAKAAHPIGSIANRSPAVLSDLAARVKVLLMEADTESGRLSAMATILASLESSVLLAQLSDFPEVVPDEAWTDRNALGRLLVPAAIAGHPQAVELVIHVDTWADLQTIDRTIAHLEHDAIASDFAREHFLRLALDNNAIAPLVRFLVRLEEGHPHLEEAKRIVAESAFRLCSSPDPEARSLGVRLRRSLIEKGQSLEDRVPDPLSLVDAAASRARNENIFALVSHRLTSGLSNAEEVLEVALEKGLSDDDAPEALLAATRACSLIPGKSQGWSAARTLIGRSDLQARHIRSLRPLLLELVAIDPSQAVVAVRSIAFEYPRLSSRTKKGADGALLEPLEQAYRSLALEDQIQLTVDLSQAHERLGVVAVRAAGRIHGTSFGGFSDALASLGLPPSVRREASRIVEPLRRQFGSAAWPELSEALSARR